MARLDESFKRKFREETMNNWLIEVEAEIASFANKVTVTCPRCNLVALIYRVQPEGSLQPKEVEHCGVKDTFYMSEAILEFRFI